jgi:hypothetical protein
MKNKYLLITIFLFAMGFISLGTEGCSEGEKTPDKLPVNETPCVDCPNTDSSIILCDDFEGDDLDANYEEVNKRPGEQMNLSSDDSFSGAQSLRQNYTTGQVDAGWVVKVKEDGFPDHLFARWYHKFENGFEGLPPKMARIRNREYINWKTGFAYHTWIDDGLLNASLYVPQSTQANSAGYLPAHFTSFSYADKANIGVWVCIEMEIKLNTPGEADGEYRLWVNNRKEAEKINVDFRGSTNLKITEVMLDTYWNAGSPKEQARYYDDFVISTNRIGCSCND